MTYAQTPAGWVAVSLQAAVACTVGGTHSCPARQPGSDASTSVACLTAMEPAPLHLHQWRAVPHLQAGQCTDHGWPVLLAQAGLQGAGLQPQLLQRSHRLQRLHLGQVRNRVLLQPQLLHSIQSTQQDPS